MQRSGTEQPDSAPFAMLHANACGEFSPEDWNGTARELASTGVNVTRPVGIGSSFILSAEAVTVVFCACMCSGSRHSRAATASVSQ
jgi:hypothetical protein